MAAKFKGRAKKKGVGNFCPHGSEPDQAASMASSWLDTPTDQHGLLLKHQIQSTVSGVRITTLLLRTRNLNTIACGRWSLVTD